MSTTWRKPPSFTTSSTAANYDYAMLTTPPAVRDQLLILTSDELNTLKGVLLAVEPLLGAKATALLTLLDASEAASKTNQQVAYTFTNLSPRHAEQLDATISAVMQTWPEDTST